MASLKDLRILIVDDSDTTRRILGAIVRSREWTVCGEAENGWTGVKKFNELMPDLVLLDFAMPEINGIEVATWMSAANPSAEVSMSSILRAAQRDSKFVALRDDKNPREVAKEA